MSTLYPEIRDTGSLAGVFSRDTFFGIGIEGQADAPGSAVVAQPYEIVEPSLADTLFGPASSLSSLTKFVLSKGIGSVHAVASAKGASPTLVQRQAAWTAHEETRDVRIRLTDSGVQADLVALADSCEWAEQIQHKQFCVVGIPTPTTEGALTAAASAIASKRGVLVGPGVLDDNGVLQTGVRAAAWVASMVSRNPDIADDLDTVPLFGSTGIEKDAIGMPLFRIRAGAGTPVNQFNTLLTAGVSPLRQGQRGQAEIVHLRTTYTLDSTFDALMTLLIKDELFNGIRNELEGHDFLRRGNTEENRTLAAKIVDTFLTARGEWVLTKELPDGTFGYGVSVIASTDKKKMIVSYQGEVVRNIQTIDIGGVLTIPA